MGFFVYREKAMENADDPGSLLSRAQGGDQEARNQLIGRFKPFILRVAANASGRYLQEGHDDEVSIGLIAFNEAIDGFNLKKGVSFLTFAETVIKRRLVDYYRRESRARKVIPFSVIHDEGEDDQEVVNNRLEAKMATDTHLAKVEAEDRREEIVHYSKILAEYGIAFSELVELSPKHEDARVRAMDVARIIAASPPLRDHLKHKKELPLKALEQEVHISRKTLERQRKYIIAIALILVEGFDFLRSYIDKSLIS